ncbi:tryptase alpha/beta-1-like [Dasypus novemcinctus]|uniref:tryptase alpha/beta-1-like n=1 Tax=Dasypus novemcinctus TaxID=9361 RepID=UPI00265EE6C9|nr:tryptase alpha/beta-1-like [Dasypus novemcinctus]
MGGQEASKSKWPWQVSQRLHAAFWVHICGGSLIHPQERVSPDAFRVQLREQHLYYGDRLLPVGRVLPHPGYYLAQEGADIALLGLRSPVNLSSRVQPLRLPPAAQAFPAGTPCWVTGWGDVSDDEPLPPPYPLRQVKVPVVDNGDCDAQYHSDTSTGDSVRIVRDDMMCAGRAGRDSCQDAFQDSPEQEARGAPARGLYVPPLRTPQAWLPSRPPELSVEPEVPPAGHPALLPGDEHPRVERESNQVDAL